MQTKLAEVSDQGDNKPVSTKVVGEPGSFFKWRLTAQGGRPQLKNIEVKAAALCD